MKYIKFILFAIGFVLIINSSKAQTLCHGDTIHLTVANYIGNLQWQVSEDLITWADIPGAIHDTVNVIAKASKYYRVRVTTGNCRTFLSDSVHIIAVACPCPNAPTVTDADGNTYPTVRIGTQCWLAKNLNTGTAKLNNQALSTTSVEKYCYGATNTNADPFGNCAIHGGLYTWNAVMQGDSTTDSVPSGVQGVCPAGWHVPSDAEWKVLELEMGIGDPDLLGYVRGTSQGTQLKAGGTANFNGLMSGKRNYTTEYMDMDTYAYFWTTRKSSVDNAWMRGLWITNPHIGRFANHINNAASVRCIKD